MSEFYTAEELSKYLKIPKPTLYYLSRKGLIPGIKIGRHWRYNKKRIEEWLRKKEKKR